MFSEQVCNLIDSDYKRVAILQSNYIPWKGYFDIIASVDEFIIYDDMQFTKNDWRNRNLIKTPQGTQWLTIPVGASIHRRIRDVELPESRWQVKHWKSLEANYGKSQYYNDISDMIAPIYEGVEHSSLSELNVLLIKIICEYLGIKTKITYSWDYKLEGMKTDRLLSLCEQTKATEYISGPLARDYLDIALFKNRGVKVSFFEYSGYREYPQLWGDFEHGVTILDLLFNCGKEAPYFMKCVEGNCHGL